MNDKLLKKARKIRKLIIKTISPFTYSRVSEFEIKSFYESPQWDLINKGLEDLPIEEQLKVLALADPKGDGNMYDDFINLLKKPKRKEK